MAKEKLSWEKLKGESAKAYNRFKIFLNLSPEERSLEKAHELIKTEEKTTNSKKSKEVTLNAIQNMSSQWCWFERAGLYDQHKILEEMKENDEDFKKTNEKFKKTFKEALDFADKLLQELMANEII